MIGIALAIAALAGLALSRKTSRDSANSLFPGPEPSTDKKVSKPYKDSETQKSANRVTVNPKDNPNVNYNVARTRFVTWWHAKKQYDFYYWEYAKFYALPGYYKEEKTSKAARDSWEGILKEELRAGPNNPIAADDRTVRDYLYSEISEYLEDEESVDWKKQGAVSLDKFKRGLDFAGARLEKYPPKDWATWGESGVLFTAKVVAIVFGTGA